MGTPYLEHLNLTVLDVDKAVCFLQTAMPQLEAEPAKSADAGSISAPNTVTWPSKIVTRRVQDRISPTSIRE